MPEPSSLAKAKSAKPASCDWVVVVVCARAPWAHSNASSAAAARAGCALKPRRAACGRWLDFSPSRVTFVDAEPPHGAAQGERHERFSHAYFTLAMAHALRS